ncbi:hypothetical protein ISS37_07880 [candidate division KSB1 bacterium]|nr:hypothetical protein [candidate division KSB1 bacterium]
MPTETHSKKKFLRIIIYEGDLEKPKTRVKIPLAAFRWVFNFIPGIAKEKLKEKSIDLEALKGMVEGGYEGTLAEIEEENQRIIIQIASEGED